MTTKQMLKVLHVLSWLIFAAVCVQAGGVLFNIFFTLVINPAGAGRFWEGADLSWLYKYGRGHFLAVTLLMSIGSILRAYLFYLIVKVLSNKRLSISQPFSQEVGRFILKTAYVTLSIGLSSCLGVGYVVWLARHGMVTPDMSYFRFSGADIWLFMSVTLFVIAQIFKRGIEIQEENELTV